MMRPELIHLTIRTCNIYTKGNNVKNILAENMRRFRTKNLTESSTDKYVGKYKNRFAMYINDEGMTYIRDRGTNMTVIDIRDDEGNERPEADIRRDILDSFNRESPAEFKQRMRGY